MRLRLIDHGICSILVTNDRFRPLRRRYGKVRICRRLRSRQISDMNWKSIRLELGSTGEFPAGSVSRVYLVRLPLNDQDTIDDEAMKQTPSRAIVQRHWSTEPDERGLVVRADGHWSMRCHGKDRLLYLDSTPIRLGGQVSVGEPNGDILPFRISSVR